MIKRILVIISVYVVVVLISCTEIGPYINLNPDTTDTTLIDTTYIASQDVNQTQKKVLISDFTGVRCPNCPKASLKIHEIDSMYPGRIVALAIHINDNPLALPYSADADYRTNAGTQIYNNLGKSLGLPSGGINQKKFPSETNILVGIDKWLSFCQQELLENSPVNIIITTNAVSGKNNEYIVRIKAEYNKAASGQNFLSICVSESGMVSLQKLPTGEIDSFYTHKHILRTMLTNPSGDLLMDNPEKNRVFVKEYKLKVSDNWKAENMEVIAYIHQSGQQFDVYQVEKINLK